MDKFPEAFKRFKEDVNVNRINTFKQLTLAFSSWSPKKWRGTSRQMDALAVQANRLGIPLEGYRTRQQQISGIFGRTAQQSIQGREKFSRNYRSFQEWQSRTVRTTAYERRIANYFRNHPNASLAEARGHRAERS
jgi:hypothetical protein